MNARVKNSFFVISIAALVPLLSITACGLEGEVTEAICEVTPTEGNTVKGTVIFRQTNEGVRIITDLTGLTPGKHGFHVHEFGDCSAPDGTSAGGHFNPGSQRHGALMDRERHAGDMGNIIADADGNAKMEFTDKMMTLNGEKSILNKGLIVHKDRDDLTTQPTGNARPREGCGVIIATSKH